MSSLSIETTYLHLTEGPEVRPVPADETFWQTIAEREDLTSGRLVTAFEMSDDWPTKERHLEGDEVVVLLSGSMDFVLFIDGEERVIELRDRGTVIVPSGVWHTARVHAPSRLLLITPCGGTEIAPVG